LAILSLFQIYIKISGIKKSNKHKKVGDYIFEVGGKGKKFTQVKDIENSFVVVDIDFSTTNNKIPLWLFGFLMNGK